MASLLISDGASLEMTSVGPEPTTIAIADVDTEGFAEYQFLVEGTSAPNLTLDMLPETFGPDVNAVYVGTLGLVLEPMASTLEELVIRESGRRLVMMDPNIRVGLIPDAEYRERLQTVISHSTIVKASEGDLAWLFPGLDHDQLADRLFSAGVRLVVVTLGGEGAFAAHRDTRMTVAAPHVDVVDTIGAGDAFGAALLAWLHIHGAIKPDLCLEPEELKAALDFACLAGAITCSRAGADPPWKWEMPAEEFVSR
jgi:fructokinase